MKLATLLTAVVSALAARAADVTIQDVYAPQFIFPAAGVTLYTGESYTFVWYSFSLETRIALCLTEPGMCLTRLPKSRTPRLASTSARTA